VEGECRIGLTTAEAMQYLTEKRQIDSARASKILEFCDTRILRLRNIWDKLDAGKNLEGPST
jgi:hypothetical protein